MSDEEDTCTGVDMVFPCRCPGCTAKRDRKREELEDCRLEPACDHVRALLERLRDVAMEAP